MCSHLNVGSGTDVSIRELAEAVQKIVGYNGKIDFDVNRPDGTPRKLMASKRLNALGWKAQTDLSEGLQLAYAAFRQTH